MNHKTQYFRLHPFRQLLCVGFCISLCTFHYEKQDNKEKARSILLNEKIDKKGEAFDQAILVSNQNSENLVKISDLHLVSQNEKDLAKQFVALSDLKGSLHKREMREETLTRLAGNLKNIEISKRILSDLDWTLTSFPNQQAQMRIYAIALLKVRAATGGDLQPLEHEIKELMRQMKQSPDAFKKGREHDLSDLLAAWIDVKGQEEILKNPEILFHEFQYEPKFKSAFYRAYAYSIQDDPVESTTGPIFKSYWNQKYD